MDHDEYLKKLSDWIKIKESEGYPEGKVKQFLLARGYTITDTNDAISKISLKKPVSKNFKFFKPTFSKTFIILVIALMIGVSFFVNKSYMPEYGANNCDAINYQKDMSNVNRYAMQLNANPEVLIKQLNDLDSRAKDSSLSYNILWKSLGVSYLYSSGLNQFNPFFPVPCPLGIQSFGEGDNCIDYFTARNRSCVTPVKYSPVGASSYFIQGILLLLVIYVMLCVFNWLGNFLTDVAQHWIIIPGLILLVLMLLIGLGLFDVSYNPYIFFILLFMAFFTLEAFAEGKWKYIWTIFFVLLIISFPFVSIFKDVTAIPIPQDNFKYCNNTITLDENSKASFFAKNNFGMDEVYYSGVATPVNICGGCLSDCSNICLERGTELLNSYSLFGTKPSCVCRCVE
jgi:hypothetical protein